MAIFPIDELVRHAGLQKVPYAGVVDWVSEQWNRLTKGEQIGTIEHDLVMLPAYRRNIINMNGTLDRAKAAGYDPEKIKLARAFLEQAGTQLRRLSNMAEVAIADAIRAKRLPDNYAVQLGEVTWKEVVIVGITTAGIIAVFVLVGPWIAAASLLVKALVAATALVLAATAYVATAAASRPKPGDIVTPGFAAATMEVSRSAVWIVAIVGAVAGLWFLSSAKRRVA
ncbi:MAG: hypothetical protein IT436_05195 [Phycisphaerales bacterium]|nr:hypothetical protein [Phycisphaerales bacterium]